MYQPELCVKLRFW